MASKIDSKNQSQPDNRATNQTAIAANNSTLNPTDNRFGRKSRSMFFIRHTAHPKNLRFITGYSLENFFFLFMLKNKLILRKKKFTKALAEYRSAR